MPNQLTLDRVFRALGDSTRRAVVERLTRGPVAASELARPFRMALPSFLQHMAVLEECGLVFSRKKGRVRTYRIAPKTLQTAQSWLDKQRALWERRLNQLEEFLKETRHED